MNSEQVNGMTCSFKQSCLRKEGEPCQEQHRRSDPSRSRLTS